jgi:two-component system phosphate regulon sensor histidine kinase PhoR
MFEHLKFEIACLLIIALLGLIGAEVWDAGTAFLLAGTSAYAGWHLFQLFRLSGLILSGGKLRELSPPGLWSVVYRNAIMLRRRSRKRRRKLSRFFKRFVESASALPDAAVVIGQGGEIEWSNPAAADLLGISWPEAAGSELAQLVGNPVFTEFLEGHDQDRSLEFPSPVDQRKILSAYVKAFGKKYQRLLVARDVTRPYYVDRMRRDFIANASHELRTPLTVIRGFLEVWSTQPNGAGSDRDRPVQLMLEQTKRMEETIRDMLTLSRLEEGDEPIADATVTVPDLMDSILNEARALSGDKGHVISVEIEDRRNIKGDAAKLRDALSNLVFNAVRHTPPRTPIRVVWSPCEGGAQLIVEDMGEGIAARHIPRLTERFYRIDPGRSRDSGGTGLGLAIVRQVLERHDAELQISSRVGEGSRFACIFPDKRLAAPDAGAQTVRDDRLISTRAG